MTLVLSSGHTSGSPGAVRGAFFEFNLNLKVAKAIYEELLRRGVPEGGPHGVVLLDPELSLKDKLKIVHRDYRGPNDVLLEIHHNVFNGKASGSEMFYNVCDTEGFAIGSKLLAKVAKTLGLRNRGMKLGFSSARGSLGWTRVPKGSLSHPLLWEVFFMDNHDDFKAPEMVALAFCDAVLGPLLSLRSVVRTGEGIKIPKVS